MEEEISLEEEFYNPKEENREKYKKKILHNNRIKKQISYNKGYFLVCEKRLGKFEFAPIEKPYIIRCSYHGPCKRKQDAKKQATRIVRHRKTATFDKGNYNKAFDFWNID